MHDFENAVYILDNEMIMLTKTENKLLKLLLEKKDRLVTYEQIAEEIYFTECDYYLKGAIRSIVSRLKKKQN